MADRSRAARACVAAGARRMGVYAGELETRKPSAQHAVLLYLVGRGACDHPVVVPKMQLCGDLALSEKAADGALRRLKMSGAVKASPRLGEKGDQMPNEYTVDTEEAAKLLAGGLNLYGCWPGEGPCDCRGDEG